MAEVKKIATRESYGNALVELGQENPNVVVLQLIKLQFLILGTHKTEML